ncbi:N2227-like family protein, putative [Babesia ovis]|uniref:carnosine N-methyltransferase n=1 Tax=Babesia ovis TaxID=5869 RepID=A0A9W5WUI0_BABOV|nr:N2227-like family protein, putative [Babesia ovis]
MDTIPSEAREEYQHFINVVYSFLSYKNDGSIDAQRIYKSMQLLSQDDKALLIEQPAARVMKMIHALYVNQGFIYAMLSCLCGQPLISEGDADDPMACPTSLKRGSDSAKKTNTIMDNLRLIVRNAPFWKIPPDIIDEEIVPTSDPEILSRNMNWVRTTLRQFVRDWSQEGDLEREQTFTPLLESLQRHVPIKKGSKPPKVLCPGCGLGRLPYEVLRLGYESQGNEFSSFMLIGSYFATNFMDKRSAYKLYPYCLSTSNMVKHEDQMYSCRIPDVAPAESDGTGLFSMCTGEFTEVYAKVDEPFNAVLTCFFLDTAKNVVAYVRTCAKILTQGGLWANIGPLLYHYADFNHNSVELSWEELRHIIKIWFTIVREEWREANYTSNQLSMMKTQYKCIYFEAIRNEVEVFGQSNPF